MDNLTTAATQTDFIKWMVVIAMPVLVIAGLLRIAKFFTAIKPQAVAGFDLPDDEYQRRMDDAVRWRPLISKSTLATLSIGYLAVIIGNDIALGLFTMWAMTKSLGLGLLFLTLFVLLDGGLWVVTFGSSMSKWGKLIFGILSAATTMFACYINGVYVQGVMDVNIVAASTDNSNMSADKKRLDLEIAGLSAKKKAQDELHSDAIKEVQKEQGRGGCKSKCQAKQKIADNIEAKVDKYAKQLEEKRGLLRTIVRKSENLRNKGAVTTKEAGMIMQYLPWVLVFFGAPFYALIFFAETEFKGIRRSSIKREAQLIRRDTNNDGTLEHLLVSYPDYVQIIAQDQSLCTATQEVKVQEVVEDDEPKRPDDAKMAKVFRLFDDGWVVKASGHRMNLKTLHDVYMRSIKDDPENTHMTLIQFQRPAAGAIAHLDDVDLSGGAILDWKPKTVV